MKGLAVLSEPGPCALARAKSSVALATSSVAPIWIIQPLWAAVGRSASTTAPVASGALRILSLFAKRLASLSCSRAGAGPTTHRKVEGVAVAMVERAVVPSKTARFALPLGASPSLASIGRGFGAAET